jgi:hydroxymethylpyrimidine pyrophosphatase-like HAD family hydrolase
MSLIIAVDFDGTVVEHEYPRIGKEKLFAFQTLRALKDKGHRLILWTIRDGKTLEAAVNYCRENGVEFYAVNETYPGEVYQDGMSRKVNADIFIDDRNVGGFLGWSEIWNAIEGNQLEYEQKKGGLLGRLFR